MLGLVESRWGGRPKSYLWYEVCRRSVACLICGSIKYARTQGSKWDWVVEHEQFHLAKMDVDKLAAAESLICMRLPNFREALNWPRTHRDWKGL